LQGKAEAIPAIFLCSQLLYYYRRLLRRTLVLSVRYSAFATTLTLFKNLLFVISLQRVSPDAIHIEPLWGSELQFIVFISPDFIPGY
jgi:hypothetical protein